MSTGVTAPLGFRAASTSCGLKAEGEDLALLVADSTCPAAAVFTTNRVQAAPIIVSRRHLETGRARAVLVNAGCANAATGARGIHDAEEQAKLVGQLLACPAQEILVASTGVIGTTLPMDKIRSGIERLGGGLSREGGASAARAILTTDTHPKETTLEFRHRGGTARIGAMAKGAGMIAPRMATLLAFFTTDVKVEASLLHRALQNAVGTSLNRITVDGDTSTNDMAVILSSGVLKGEAILEEGRDFDGFSEALEEVARRMALMIVSDGEGATRTAEVRVEGAPNSEDAESLARTVANSPLFKTALHGGDPNWGRILAALGRAGVALNPDRVDIFLGDVWVAQGGCARDYDEARAHAAMCESPVRVRIRLGVGEGQAAFWTCDLSSKYVDINAHYRS